jgi:putative FmdB family regulatory protein
MPIYEFACRACHTEFEKLVRGDTVPQCPACESADLERLLSLPKVTSETTRGLVKRAAKARDKAQATDRAAEQRKYELSHDD